MKKWIPYIGFLGFFILNIIAGILLISGITPPLYYEDPPGFAPLTYFDLLILIGLNIPSIIIIILSIKKTRKSDNTKE
ncbi:MAG: hypothetical protein ACTSPY_01495 [Candidatus Helarchaeota archaeon]